MSPAPSPVPVQTCLSQSAVLFNIFFNLILNIPCDHAATISTVMT